MKIEPCTIMRDLDTLELFLAGETDHKRSEIIELRFRKESAQEYITRYNNLLNETKQVAEQVKKELLSGYDDKAISLITDFKIRKENTK